MSRAPARHVSIWRRVAMASALVGLGLAGAATPALGHAGHGHPARIHEGSCEDLGRVAFRLNGVGAGVDLDNAPLEVPAEINPDRAYQVMLSNTLIDGSLDDLLAGDYAVMIYASDDEMNAITCGNLGGAITGETLITGLAEMGVAGHLGFAIFTPVGAQTEVELIIGHALAPVSAGGAADPGVVGDGRTDAEVEDHDNAGEEGHAPSATPVP